MHIQKCKGKPTPQVCKEASNKLFPHRPKRGRWP